MARPDMRGSESMANGGPGDAAPRGRVRTQKNDRSSPRPPTRPASRVERDRMVKQARDSEFPIVMRGYDRNAVNRYVEQVNRLIAELEISSSPEAAVRHALDEVSDETRELLQRAHATAEEITARSRSKADDRLQTAEREAAELREAARHGAEEMRAAAVREVTELRETAQREVADLRETAAREAQQVRATAQQTSDEVRSSARTEAKALLEAAETRAHGLARNAETIWRERRRLIEDMRVVGAQLVAIGDAEAAKRFAQFGEDGEAVMEPSPVPGRR